MGGSFKEARQKRLPRWLGGFKSTSYGRAYQGVIGDAQDGEAELLRDAVKLRYPATCPDDGLPFAGKDRLLERAPPESGDAFRLRLEAAPDDNFWIGTRRGIRNIFKPYGFDDSTCHVFHDYEIDFFGFDPAWFSRVWIVLEDIGIWTADGTWGSGGTWDDGGTWDSTILVVDEGYFRRQILVRKSIASYPVLIIACITGGIWDVGGGTWDDGALWTDDDQVIYITIGNVWGSEAWGQGQLWDDGGTWESGYETGMG